ncbi:hypothetical protein [Mariprofundus erugo]|uniref:hypothetical protein n=1 Tax=Mariprofundus erugo TaxID=2528639 RepID=UPI00159C9FC4|nr:hypothetical protein [Mariprofundus erugo]
MKKFIARFVCVLLVMLPLASCSVYMASKQPEKKDLSVLQAGSDRGHVIAELGTPVYTEATDSGRMDLYKFVQGYSKSAKAGRALFHGAADVVTLGLWEAIGTPLEGMSDGTEVVLEVYYDREDKVERVKSVSGEEALKGYAVPEGVKSPKELSNKEKSGA